MFAKILNYFEQIVLHSIVQYDKDLIKLQWTNIIFAINHLATDNRSIFRSICMFVLNSENSFELIFNINFVEKNHLTPKTIFHLSLKSFKQA